MEMDKGRGVDLADVEDPRVDLCLFCIQAHRLRPVDLRYVPAAVTAVDFAHARGMIASAAVVLRLFCIQAQQAAICRFAVRLFCCPCSGFYLCQGHAPAAITLCLFSIQAHRLCPVGLQCTASAATALKYDGFICLLLLMPPVHLSYCEL